MKLLEDKLLVEILPKTEKTTGGIFILDTIEQDDLPRAKIIEIGINAINVSKNDVVAIGKYSGTEVLHLGKPYKIIREADIMFIE